LRVPLEELCLTIKALQLGKAGPVLAEALVSAPVSVSLTGPAPLLIQYDSLQSSLVSPVT
jgi:hypothetical protein